MSTELTSRLRLSTAKVKQECSDNMVVSDNSKPSISKTSLTSNVKYMKTVNGILFEAVLSEEECSFYQKAHPNVRDIINRKIHCTVCKVHIGTAPAQEQSIRMHPILRVTHCIKCHDFYNSGEFVRGDDGSELYCRWCGQGGEVYCCSNCPYVFCKLCIQSNLSASVVADIEQNENWECFSCAPKILWPIRALHWALMRYINHRKNEINAMNITELEKKQRMLLDNSKCCRLNRTKSIEMTNTAGTTISSDNITEMANSSNNTAINNSTIYNNNNTRKSLKLSKQSLNCSMMVPSNAKRLKQTHNNNFSNIDNNTKSKVVCTPDLISMLTPDCQLTVGSQQIQQQQEHVQVSSEESTFIDVKGLRNLTKNRPMQYSNEEIQPQLRQVVTPTQIVKRTKVTTQVPMLIDSNSPFVHNINGYNVDLNYASTQQYFSLPNGRIIQVRRHNNDHEDEDSDDTANTSNVGIKKIISTSYGGWRVVELTPQQHKELQQKEHAQQKQQEQHNHLQQDEFQQQNSVRQQQLHSVTISTSGIHNNVSNPNNMVRIIRQQHHQQQAIPNIINHSQNISTKQSSTVITPISGVTLKNGGIAASVYSMNGQTVSSHNSAQSTGQTQTIISHSKQHQQQHLHHHILTTNHHQQQQPMGSQLINVRPAISVSIDEQQRFQQQQQQQLPICSLTPQTSNRIQSSSTNICGHHILSGNPQISLRNSTNQFTNNQNTIQQQIQHNQQQQSTLLAANESGILKTRMIRYNFPNTSIGQARSHLQDRIHNTVDICGHIVTKLNALTNSNAYKQAKTSTEVKELYIHKSYLLTYAIGRFKTLQDKCLADMRSMGFHHEADCLQKGQLAAGNGNYDINDDNDGDGDNNNGNTIVPVQQSEDYRNADELQIEKSEALDNEVIIDYVDLEAEEEMVTREIAIKQEYDNLCAIDNIIKQEPDTANTNFINCAYSVEDVCASGDPNETDLFSDDENATYNNTSIEGTLPKVVKDDETTCKDKNSEIVGEIVNRVDLNKSPKLFDNMLTNAVKKYPAIWCNEHVDYFRIKYRCLLWHELEKQLGHKSMDLRIRWRKIRSRYVKIENKIAKGKTFAGFFDISTAFLVNRNISPERWIALDECDELKLIEEPSPEALKQISLKANSKFLQIFNKFQELQKSYKKLKMNKINDNNEE